MYAPRLRGAVLAKGVTVLRGTEKDGYPFLDKPFQVSVVSVAALRGPWLRETSPPTYAYTSDVCTMKFKIRVMLRAMRASGCDVALLSAFGCGAFHNPPAEVARLFREALEVEPMRVVFCIFNDHNGGNWHNPDGNFAPFAREFKSV
jgi:uncharacterized protein (TIGR02452 family)